jgi:L-asparaginase
MKKILIISTGGTFNKVYNPTDGKLVVDTKSKAIQHIAKKWLTDFNIKNIIGKDSLEMDDNDRQLLINTVIGSKEKTIIIIHGTDTMDKSAVELAHAECKKLVIFTGAMVPYHIDSVEATANLSSAIGYANGLEKNGVYIAMNGVFGEYSQVTKDRKKGKFVAKTFN